MLGKLKTESVCRIFFFFFFWGGGCKFLFFMTLFIYVSVIICFTTIDFVSKLKYTDCLCKTALICTFDVRSQVLFCTDFCV